MNREDVVDVITEEQIYNKIRMKIEQCCMVQGNKKVIIMVPSIHCAKLLQFGYGN